MEKNIENYQGVVIFDSNLNDEAVQAEVAKIKATCEKENGGIKKTDIWGRRRLAYRINKKEFGIYAVIEMHGGQALVSTLDRQLRINDNVMRHMIVIKDEYAPDFNERLIEADSFNPGEGDGTEDGLYDDGDVVGAEI